MSIIGNATKRIVRFSGRIFAGTVFVSFAAATYYRPLPDDDETVVNHNVKNQHHPTSSSFKHSHMSPSSDNNSRSEAWFCSSKSYPSMTSEETPLLLSIARALSINITTLVIRFFLKTYGSYEILDADLDNGYNGNKAKNNSSKPLNEYTHFLDLVRNRANYRCNDDESSQAASNLNRKGLLTVSNHRSLFDDPGVVSCLLPLDVALVSPKYNRWGICSQEYCFNPNLPAAIKGYIGAGQVLPIRRGGGIDQWLLRDFAAFLSRGEWCHIFPEGCVTQIDGLGGRSRCFGGQHGHNTTYGDVNKKNINEKSSSDSRNHANKLKWGVGKLIAHAPITPHVIPFAHVGMENLLPQDPQTGITHLKKQLFGKNSEPLEIKIKVGKELFFDDLIQEHEEQHGKLWRYSDRTDAGGSDNNRAFKSSVEEKILYHKITMRIEDALEALTKEVIRRHKKSNSE